MMVLKGLATLFRWWTAEVLGFEARYGFSMFASRLWSVLLFRCSNISFALTKGFTLFIFIFRVSVASNCFMEIYLRLRNCRWAILFCTGLAELNVPFASAAPSSNFPGFNGYESVYASSTLPLFVISNVAFFTYAFRLSLMVLWAFFICTRSASSLSFFSLFIIEFANYGI